MKEKAKIYYFLDGKFKWPFYLIVVLCFPADMIPENALEEMTKNMDPNLVIVEGKEGVQMK